MIEDIKKTSKEQHEQISKELSDRIDKVEEKVEEISQFKWKAVGAIVIVAFLVGIVPAISSILTKTTEHTRIERTK